MKKITRKAKQVSQNNLKFISTRLVASDVKRLIVKKSGGREREGRIIESDGGGGIEGARAIWKSNDFRSWLHSSFQAGSGGEEIVAIAIFVGRDPTQPRTRPVYKGRPVFSNPSLSRFFG